MQFKTSFLALAVLLTSSATARLEGHERRTANSIDARSDSNWLKTPEGEGSSNGFGERTSSGTANAVSFISYAGNVGKPYGSNIIQISENDAPQYKNVLQLTGENQEPWTVQFWNKAGPDGKLDGFFGHSAVTFDLAPGETKYVAVDADSRGGFGAAKGGVPKSESGEFASTWGEFDFSSNQNGGWSGYDVSIIQAQSAGKDIQGMKICEAPGDKSCSSVSNGGANVQNAYTQSQASQGGVGGNIPGGPVRLAVTIGYQG